MGDSSTMADEVVATYPVYAATALAGHVHVFQYPLRRRGQPYEASHMRLFVTDGEALRAGEADREGVKDVIHPTSRLTLRCTLDTFGSTSFRGEAESDDVEGDKVHEYTLVSQPFAPRSEYMVACIAPDGVHVTPVRTVQQMVPDLTSARATTASGACRVPDAFCTLQTSPLVSGLATSNRLRRELNRQRSAALNADAASAVQVRVFAAASRESALVRRRLLSTTPEPTAATRALSCGAALDLHFPPEILVSGGITGGEAAEEATVIHAFADRQPLATQVRQLLARCQVLPLELVLANVVASRGEARDGPVQATVSETHVVNCLRGCAAFMHGVWVARGCARFQGSAAALRELVLVHFSQSDDATVRRATLNALVGCAAPVRRLVKEILQSVAVLHGDEAGERVWRLRYAPADTRAAVDRFAHQFPSDAAAQRELWRRVAQLVRGHVPYLQSGRLPPRLFLGGDGEGSTSRSGAAQPLGDETARSTTDARGTGIEGTAGFSDAELAPVRAYIRTVFAEYGVLNKQRAKELVLRGREVHYPSASNAVLSAALQSCVQSFTPSTWVLKSLGEPMTDQHRPLILQAALQLQTFSVRALQARLQELLSADGVARAETDATPGSEEGPPVRIVQRVVAEVAEYKQGERLWHLKSGNAMQ